MAYRKESFGDRERRESIEVSNFTDTRVLYDGLASLLEGYDKYIEYVKQCRDKFNKWVDEYALNKKEKVEGYVKFKYDPKMYVNSIPEFIVDLLREMNVTKNNYILEPFIAYKQLLLEHNKSLIINKRIKHYPDKLYRVMLDEIKHFTHDASNLLYDIRDLVMSIHIKVDTMNDRAIAQFLLDDMVDTIITKISNFIETSIIVNRDKVIHIEHGIQILLMDLELLWTGSNQDHLSMFK